MPLLPSTRRSTRELLVVSPIPPCQGTYVHVEIVITIIMLNSQNNHNHSTKYKYLQILIKSIQKISLLPFSYCYLVLGMPSSSRGRFLSSIRICLSILLSKYYSPKLVTTRYTLYVHCLGLHWQLLSTSQPTKL